MTQPSPIVTPGRIKARAPIQQPLPTVIGYPTPVSARCYGPPRMYDDVQNITSIAMLQRVPISMRARASKKQP